MKEIKIDQDMCIGCGTCGAISPDHFEVEAGEKAKVLAQYNEATASEVEEAAQSCPAGAIEITEK